MEYEKKEFLLGLARNVCNPNIENQSHKNRLMFELRGIREDDAKRRAAKMQEYGEMIAHDFGEQYSTSKVVDGQVVSKSTTDLFYERNKIDRKSVV